MNGRKLLGLNHVEVVVILKELPRDVRIVCGRRRSASSTAPPMAPIEGPQEDETFHHSREEGDEPVDDEEDEDKYNKVSLLVLYCDVWNHFAHLVQDGHNYK